MGSHLYRLLALGAATALLAAAAALALAKGGGGTQTIAPLDAEQLAAEAEEQALERSPERILERRRSQTSIAGSGQGSARPGKPAPAFELPGSQGQVKLGDYEGRPLVIEFAQSSCPHCQAMAPVFDSVMRSHPDVAFLVIGVSEPPKATERWHRSFLGHPMPGDLAFDRNLEAARLYGVVGTPTTVLVDGDGKVVEIIPGEIKQSELEQKVAALKRG